jgi:hypothetical protein
LLSHDEVIRETFKFFRWNYGIPDEVPNGKVVEYMQRDEEDNIYRDVALDSNWYPIQLAKALDAYSQECHKCDDGYLGRPCDDCQAVIEVNRCWQEALGELEKLQEYKPIAERLGLIQLKKAVNLIGV